MDGRVGLLNIYFYLCA